MSHAFHDLSVVQPQWVTFAQSSLLLESGKTFGTLTVQYETYGTLNEDRSNAILLVHAFSGDAHVAGYHD